ncbi:MAG: HAD family hydrolase [Acidobacteria bacterium]|nr:HAD family hydrolase [Acidobacteriota bacterium]
MGVELNTILIDLDATLITLDWRKNMHKYYRKLKEILHDLDLKSSYFFDVKWAANKTMNDETDDMINIEKYFSYLNKKTDIEDKKNREFYFRFYDEMFADFRGDVREVEGSHDLIAAAKSKGFKIILATNPLFPLSAVSERLRWGNLDPEDFNFITHMQNFHHCKPSPKYFAEIMKTQKVDPVKALMVGDDYKYDIIPSKKMGFHTWWHLPNKPMKKRKGTLSGRLTYLVDALNSSEISNLL